MQRLLCFSIGLLNLNVVYAQENAAVPQPPTPIRSDVATEPSPDRADTQEVAPKPEVCARIVCSGHGTCIEKNGSPVCACDAGYTPDTFSGLNCMPLQAAPPLPGQAAVAAVAVLEAERAAALAAFQSALPGFPAERYYTDFVRIRSIGRYDRTFFDYMAGEFGKKRGGAIAMSAIGGSLLLAGLIIIPIGVNAESIFDPCPPTSGDETESCTDPEESKAILIAMGSTLSIGGAVMLGIGIPKAIKAAKRLEAVNTLRPRQESPTPQNTAPVSNLSVFYRYVPEQNAAFLAAGLRF